MSRSAWIVKPPGYDDMRFEDLTERQARRHARNQIGVKRLPNGTEVIEEIIPDEPEYAPPFSVEPQDTPFGVPDGFKIVDANGKCRGTRRKEETAKMQARVWTAGDDRVIRDDGVVYRAGDFATLEAATS